MTDLKRTTVANRFSSFNIRAISYKTVNEHPISIGLLIPKSLKPGKHPLLVKFHGGGLSTGDGLYRDWFSNFFVDFIHRNNAIVVLPNYRLVPEHSGDDILEDVRDVWKWIDDGLSKYVASIDPTIELDFDRILVSGESAGAWTGLHSVLSLPVGKIKATLFQYPMVEFWAAKNRPIPFDEASLPRSLLEEHLATLPDGKVVSSATPPARFNVTAGLAVHYDIWQERFGTGRHLHPTNALEGAKYFPPTLILHGAQDSHVDLNESKNFVQKVGEILGTDVADEVRLIVKEGDHGFDVELVEEDTPWLKEQLEWIQDVWLA